MTIVGQYPVAMDWRSRPEFITLRVGVIGHERLGDKKRTESCKAQGAWIERTKWDSAT